ncbi:LacI family DNA-binding transcriptional regulator [Arthrobacter sedimenti]|uniref:LacI family DNA-binding transcriptional regulator n=1 Tax=Arthrobacter sedimenti TaxID=2694931 RepID=UPI001423F4D1|nr:LacI family DNA-binding transcriptional regulator [Arthrobacter sedimenti]
MTISDVARQAGVSTGTVSNVLNRPDRVDPGMVKRVQSAISALGYVRNSAARSLAAGSSSSVGFVLVDLANSFFADMARGAEVEAERSGFYLLLANSDVRVEKQKAYLEHFAQEQVAGTLLTAVGSDLSGVPDARGAGQHVVLLDVDPSCAATSCTVTTDYEAAGYLAATHLIGLGRRHIAFAGGPLTSHAVGGRWRGAQRAVAESGGYAALEHLDSSDVRVKDGQMIGERLLAERTGGTDGIVAAADLVAFGLMQRLLEGGVQIPAEVALVACDDNKSAYGSAVPISTIDLPGFEMGRSAMQLLLDELQNEEHHLHRNVVIPPRLTVRESSVGRT